MSLSICKCLRLVVVLSLIGGCQTGLVEQNEDWSRYHEEDLVKRFGEPNHKIAKLDGGKTLVWEENQSYLPTGAGKTGFPIEHVSICRKTFDIDEAHVIRSWAFEGCH